MSRDKGVFWSRACPNPFPDVRLQKTRYSSSSSDFYLILLSYRNNIVRSAAVIFPLKITLDVNNVFIFLRRRSPPRFVSVGRWWRTVQTPSVPPPVCTSFSCLRFSRGCCCWRYLIRSSRVVRGGGVNDNVVVFFSLHILWFILWIDPSVILLFIKNARV